MDGRTPMARGRVLNPVAVAGGAGAWLLLGDAQLHVGLDLGTEKF